MSYLKLTVLSFDVKHKYVILITPSKQKVFSITAIINRSFASKIQNVLWNYFNLFTTNNM